MFGCKSAPFHNCSIRAPFSVARSVISGGYHRGSFEPVIKAIVRWLQMRLQIWLRTMRDWRRWAIRVSPSLPPGLYHDSLLWCINGASSSANALSAIDAFYTFVEAVVELQRRARSAKECESNKKITSYKACECNSSITIGLCGVAILQEVVHTRAPDWNGTWNGSSKATYWNGAKNLISTTVYSIACKFDALTDMEELHIQTASDLPNNTLIFIFELRFRYNMEPPYP